MSFPAHKNRDNNDGLTLSITKIGHLLLEKKISKASKGGEISDVLLKIPNYQRPYKWSVSTALQLFDDIVEAMNLNKEVYRMGTLILHRTFEDGETVYNIVDGQQRLITLGLVFHIMHLTVGGFDSPPILDQNLDDNNHNRYNIRANSMALSRRIGSMKKEEQGHLLEFLKSNCELIVVITEDISEAFQFFDSQNVRGRKLYPHDLLKAYHLREMSDVDEAQTEKIIKGWEEIDQRHLAELFAEYLYRLKEWIKGNRADELTEQNIRIFKGITRQDNSPFAQFYKSAYSYADMMNHSAMPFVMGTIKMNPFQIGTPIIAGKPFFEYTRHYFGILKDIQNNDKYEGYFINDNEIVKTLDLRHYKYGVGNRIARLLFDTAALLYVDRFCSEKPSQTDLTFFEKFVEYAFIWAYSLRAQYYNLGWTSADNYIAGTSGKTNAMNIYKIIIESDTPMLLLNTLAEKLKPLKAKDVKTKKDNIDEKVGEPGIYQNYLHFFQSNKYYIK